MKSPKIHIIFKKSNAWKGKLKASCIREMVYWSLLSFSGWGCGLFSFQASFPGSSASDSLLELSLPLLLLWLSLQSFSCALSLYFLLLFSSCIFLSGVSGRTDSLVVASPGICVSCQVQVPLGKRRAGFGVQSFFGSSFLLEVKLLALEVTTNQSWPQDKLSGNPHFRFWWLLSNWWTTQL